MNTSSRNRRVGYLLACVSIVLVSVAQLIMKAALAVLPPLLSLSPGCLGELRLWLLLGVGLLCYFFSLIIWYFTLQHLALGKAYALLSLSYVFVWLGAVCLPYYDENFSLRALGGMVAVVTGVLLVCYPSAKEA